MSSFVFRRSYPDFRRISVDICVLHDPRKARAGHLLSQHLFHLKKLCMIQMDHPRCLKVEPYLAQKAHQDCTWFGLCLISFHWLATVQDTSSM